MKLFKLKILGFLLLLFVVSSTSSCEAFWQAVADSNAQTDNNNNSDNNNNNDYDSDDDSSTSKGKGQ